MDLKKGNRGLCLFCTFIHLERIRKTAKKKKKKKKGLDSQ
jgi:hypothetical protein